MPYPNLASYVAAHTRAGVLATDLSLTSAQAARAINDDAADSGENFTTSERSVRRWRSWLMLDDEPTPEVTTEAVEPRILVCDIETSPNLAHVWQLWNTNVRPVAIQVPSEVLCFAAKWLDSDDVIFRSIFHDSKQVMLETAHELLSEADMVISYNGKKFDSRMINRDLLKAGFAPPTPYRHIDLDLTTKSVFAFPSHSLNYVSGELGIGQKIEHAGYELWRACVMDNDPDSWEQMKEYNIGDVLLTEKLYYRILPWIKNHPSRSVMSADDLRHCPACGSTNCIRKGFAYTQMSVYQRWSCNDCGKPFRDTQREKTRTLTTEVPVT